MPVDSPLEVGSQAVAGNYLVGILPAADRTHLVDSLLEVDCSSRVGMLLVADIGLTVGMDLVEDNCPVDSLSAEVVDHLVGNYLVEDSHLAGSPHCPALAGWGLVAGQDSNSYYCSSFLENERVAT